MTYSSSTALISVRLGQICALSGWFAAPARILVADDLVAELDALVADIHAGAGDHAAHLILRFAAERAAHDFLDLIIRLPLFASF